MSSRKVKIGLMQVRADDTGTVEQFQDEMLYYAEECFREGAQLVFMPEAYQYRIARQELTPHELTQMYSEKYKVKCSELAIKYHAYIVPWDYELDKEGKVYNTSYILDRNGKEIGRYRKTHITYGEERKGLDKGKELPVFDLDFGKIGIMICYDNYYAETARVLALKGAELILYPLYGDTMKEQWDIKLKARAIDNTVYIASAAIDSENSYSGMIDPMGRVICKLEAKGSWKVVEIDLGERIITNTSAKPGQYEYIKECLLYGRNTDVYGELTKQIKTPSLEEIIIYK